METHDAGEQVSRPPIRLVIVEDEALYRELLATALASHPRFEVVQAFQDAGGALAEIPDLAPDVALLDIELGGPIHGVRLGTLLRRALPRLGIVLLSNHADPDFLAAVPRQEVTGWAYLLKRSVTDLAALERAIEGAAAGLVVLDPKLAAAPMSGEGGLGRLTPRQFEILRLIAQGHTNAGIARRLGLSAKSVENQINVIYQELDIDTADREMHPRVRAVLLYLEHLT